MDKQTNILSNTKNLIPVNTRTVGAPEGIYILYLEDYVHTFIKKILSDKKSQNAPQEENEQEYRIEDSPHPNLALYGRYIEENGRYRIVVSGAAVLDKGNEKIQQINDTYFPSCTYVGNARVCLNKDSKLRLELTLHSTKVILDDFYIYYDQNEEMQNYLVEWNTIPISPTEHDPYMRSNMNDAVRLSRITQAYNREEAKVSFMWNVMNILCLGFVVCFMAYGIISVNNYNKMQMMQANIDYCMAFVAENTSFNIKTQKTEANQDEGQVVPVMQQNVQAESEMTQNSAVQEETTEQGTEYQSIQDLTKTQTQDIAETETQQTQFEEEETQSEPQSKAEPEQEQEQDLAQATTPQYYIVRKGDTLRTICYDVYGDYSRVEEVCRWNNITDPDNILYGQKLLLP